MEQLTESIDLDIDESNDLAFKIRMEGVSSTPAKVRLVCEGKDFSYMFSGYGTGEPDVVQFTIPQMTSKLSEGQYSARVEVLVENRYFSPLNFQINFKKTVTVVAEAHSIHVIPKQVKPEVKVTAVPVVLQKTAPQAAPTIKFEQKSQDVASNTHVDETPAPLPTVESKPSSLKEAYLKKTKQEAQLKKLKK